MLSQVILPKMKKSCCKFEKSIICAKCLEKFCLQHSWLEGDFYICRKCAKYLLH